jgi:hypothetical protein
MNPILIQVEDLSLPKTPSEIAIIKVSTESTIIISKNKRSYFYFGYVCCIIIIIATVVGIDNFIL